MDDPKTKMDALFHQTIQKTDNIEDPDSINTIIDQTVDLGFDTASTIQERSYIAKSRAQTDYHARFAYEQPIGQGSFGVVYKAMDADIKRNVAIKQPLSCQSEQERREFFEEVCLSSQVEHYGTPAIYDVGVDENDTPYCIMRYVEGKTVREIITLLQEGDQEMHKRFPFHRRAELILQVLCVLRAAHQKGIVHRDIKPENILISPLNEVVLIDWGIALNTHEHSGAEEFCGTPYYMSPEQFHREALDGRSDIYSLNVVLFEFLCLKRLVPRQDTLAHLQKEIMKKAPAVDLIAHAHQSYVPSEYKLVLNKGLQKNREDRFQNAEEMLVRLQDIQSGYIDSICHRTLLKSWVFRYLRWLDKHPYPHIYASYITILAMFWGLLGIGFFLGRL